MAMDLSVTTTEDAVLTKSTRNDGVLGNDVDPDAGHQMQLVVDSFGVGTTGTGTPAGGTLSLSTLASLTIASNGTFTFDPSTEYQYLAVGDSTVQTVYYVVKDPDNSTDVGALHINITGVSLSQVSSTDCCCAVLTTHPATTHAAQ